MGKRITKTNLAYTGSCYGPSPTVRKSMEKSLGMANSYPYEGYMELKKAIAAYAKVNPENIMVTNGCDEAIALTTYMFGVHIQASEAQLRSLLLKFILNGELAMLCLLILIAEPKVISGEHTKNLGLYFAAATGITFTAMTLGTSYFVLAFAGFVLSLIGGIICFAI